MTANPSALAARAHSAARRFRLLPRGIDELERGQPRRLSVRSGAQFATGREIGAELGEAETEARRTGKSARRFKDFDYSTLDTWSRRRRVVGKAEWTSGEANPRFVVTTLKPIEQGPRELYEDINCARGDMENRIKESQADLFADRTSTATMKANQLRLWFSSFAYVLVCAVRRIGLRHTQFADATAGAIRLKLFKIGALVKVSARRIKFALPTACPYANEWRLAAADLARAAPV